MSYPDADCEEYAEPCEKAFGRKTSTVNAHLSKMDAAFLDNVPRFLNSTNTFDRYVNEHFENATSCVSNRLCKAEQRQGGDEGHKYVMLQYIIKLEERMAMAVFSGNYGLVIEYRKKLKELRERVENLETAANDSGSSRPTKRSRPIPPPGYIKPNSSV